MKIARALSLAITLAAAASAFADPAGSAGSAGNAANAANNPPPADVAKFVAFFDKIVDAAVANKDSCPKMATAVNAVVDANQALLALAKDEKSKGKTLPQDAKDHIMASSKRLIPVMQTCAKDDAVMTAFKRLDMK